MPRAVSHGRRVCVAGRSVLVPGRHRRRVAVVRVRRRAALVSVRLTGGVRVVFGGGGFVGGGMVFGGGRLVVRVFRRGSSRLVVRFRRSHMLRVLTRRRRRVVVHGGGVVVGRRRMRRRRRFARPRPHVVPRRRLRRLNLAVLVPHFGGAAHGHAQRPRKVAGQEERGDHHSGNRDAARDRGAAAGRGPGGDGGGADFHVDGLEAGAAGLCGVWVEKVNWTRGEKKKKRPRVRATLPRSVMRAGINNTQTRPTRRW